MSHGGWGDTRISGVAACHPERRHYAKGLCRECYRTQPTFLAMRATYYRANKPLFRAQYQRAKAGRRKLVKRFQMPASDLAAMLAAQGGCCALCGDPPKRKQLALDHDHRTGRVRAFLCHPCNGALGLFRDDPERLARAIRYLHHHSVSAAHAAARHS